MDLMRHGPTHEARCRHRTDREDRDSERQADPRASGAREAM